MAIVLPGGGGGDNHDDHKNYDRPMDVGVDVEYLSSYHHVKDGNGGSGGNGAVPSLSVVGRGRLRGLQRGMTSSTTTIASTWNPNMTSPSSERFYRALNDVMIAVVISPSFYRQSEGRGEKDKPIIGSTGGGGGGEDGDSEDEVGGD